MPLLLTSQNSYHILRDVKNVYCTEFDNHDQQYIEIQGKMHFCKASELSSKRLFFLYSLLYAAAWARATLSLHAALTKYKVIPKLCLDRLCCHLPNLHENTEDAYRPPNRTAT